MIKEEKGYIFLKMPEFIGSLNCEDIGIYPIYESMNKKNKKVNNRSDKDDDDDDDDEDEEDGEDEKNNNKNTIYKGGKGSLRYNAYYDICYAVYLLHSHNFIHGNISKENIFYYKKHFYLSDYCEYLLFDNDNKNIPKKDIDYSIRNDLFRLGKIQKHLSKQVPRGFNFATDEKIDERRYPDEVIKQLWEKTQKFDIKAVEILLKELEYLELKDWGEIYEKDPSNSNTYSCVADESENAECRADELREKNSELLARIFALEKEKNEYIDKIEELMNENENSKKEKNIAQMKRKKLEIN